MKYMSHYITTIKVMVEKPKEFYFIVGHGARVQNPFPIFFLLRCESDLHEKKG